MVVKILSSAGSFSGVEYNENKVSAGTAKLMAAENMGLLEIDGSAAGRAVHEYQQFFQAWSANERGGIKNPQFHVALSCKGREYNAEELKVIAEQYLEKMGYKSNPYLIYFHSDTDNNHVHVVSSRIDENRLKINDSFEYRRSQTAIKEILGQETGVEISDQVKKALAYNFSSDAQFKLILEAKGITVREKEGRYQFISAGAVAHEVAKDLLDEKIKSYQEPEERIQQLRALFTKYKPALSPEQFSEFMKAKFGVDVIYHTAKGKETPYGYSIIDHSKGQVLKGSQVMKLSGLLSLATREDRLKAGGELITTLAEDKNLRYREFKSQLGQLGFDLNSIGQVKISGEEKTSFTISKERMKQIMYNDRLYEAQKFSVRNADESQILRKVMFLKKEDTDLLRTQVPGADQEQAKMILSDKLNSLLSTGKDLGDIARENDYAFAKQASTVYLIDKRNHALYNTAELTDKKIDYSSAEVIDVDRAGHPDQSRQAEYSSGTFGEIASLLYNIMEDNSQADNPDKKRKRKRNN